MRAITLSLAAVLRRFAVALLVGIATYTVDAWPEALRKAMESEPATVGLVGLVWLAVEWAQKYLRERLRERIEG